MHKILLLGACLAALASPVCAGTILQFTGDSTVGGGPANYHIGEIRVGAANVVITGWGVYGSAPGAEQMKWVLFDEITPTAPIFQSAATAIPQTSVKQWYDFTLPTNISLIANHEYAIGVVTTANFLLGNTFNAFGGLPSQTEGGITRLGSDLVIASGVTGGVFTTTPALSFGTTGDNRFADAMRIFTPDPASVPEPLSIAILGIGLLGLGVVRHRRA